MCLIIDINTLAAVFDKSNSQHDEFEPVLSWIVNGRGKVVYGGTKYIEELSKTKYLAFFLQLRKAEKAHYVDNLLVDKVQKEVIQAIVHKDFDDQHIVALLVVSKCKLVCSLDERAYPFFVHKTFFNGANKPKIYRQKSNKRLLTLANIAEICFPCDATTKLQRKLIGYR